MKKNVTKADLVALVSKQTGVKEHETRFVIESLFKTIPDVLKTGHNIELRGFGCFKKIRRKAKVVRDIGRGKAINLPERDVITFKFSKELQ